MYNVNHYSKTIIGAIYRPQNTDLAPFNLKFEKTIKPFAKFKLILLGDYNINLLNHETNSKTGNFFSTLFANTLLPVISKQTRHGEPSATLTDNIITNIYSEKNVAGIILEDISDHLPIFFITGSSENIKSSTKKEKI